MSRADRPPCSVDGCTNPSRAKGWCKRHYERWRTTGTVDLKVPEMVTCSANGCDARAHAKSLCYKHYFRWYRKGHTDRDYQPGHLTGTSHGYRSRSAHGHPLADKRGRIYNHRFVLYESIGDGPHPCHWCGVMVDWTDPPISRLEVDHVSGNKGDDSLSNLVPSCGPCNRLRSRWPAAFANRCNVAAGPAPH